MEGGGREPHIPVSISRNGIGGGQNKCSNLNVKGLQRNWKSRNDCCFGIDKSEQGQPREYANTLTAREDRGVSNQRQTGTALAIILGEPNGN